MYMPNNPSLLDSLRTIHFMLELVLHPGGWWNHLKSPP